MSTPPFESLTLSASSELCTKICIIFQIYLPVQQISLPLDLIGYETHQFPFMWITCFLTRSLFAIFLKLSSHSLKFLCPEHFKSLFYLFEHLKHSYFILYFRYSSTWNLCKFISVCCFWFRICLPVCVTVSSAPPLQDRSWENSPTPGWSGVAPQGGCVLASARGLRTPAV